MTNDARCIETCLPAITRALFTLEGDHPANNLTLAQLRLCALLRDGPQSMSSLSRELGTSVSAITQIADRLEAGRMVERCADATDRRLRCVRLTEYASEVMESRRKVRMGRALVALSGLSADDRHALLNLLARFLDGARGLP